MYSDDFLLRNKPILIFLFIYFGFQIFAQIYGKYIDKLPSTKNYIQNFITALVLIGLVIIYGMPEILFNVYSLIFIILTFVFLLIYCYAKKTLDEMSEKDKKLGRSSLMRSITLVMLFLYGGLALMYLASYFRECESKSQFVTVFTIIILYIAMVSSFYGFKDPDDKDNMAIGLFLYPLLFLTGGMNSNKFMRYSYLVIYTTVIALWGFFGVEWFTGKKEYEGINAKTCKAYLGISDEQLASPIDAPTATKLNSRNINFLYTAIGLIFVTFVIALVFIFISFQKVTFA